jgi:RND family efflux transporter MFP subunit
LLTDNAASRGSRQRWQRDEPEIRYNKRSVLRVLSVLSGEMPFGRPSRALGLLALMAATGCGGGGSQAEQPNGDAAVLVTPDNIVVADSARIESGPTISGTLQPQDVANVRAEVAGPVVQTYAERGQTVSRGALLARLDDAALRDAFLSARSAVTTAEQSAEVARRNLERQERLAAAGAVSESSLENARLAAQSAESQHADARARLALAQQQLAKTEVRSPMAGIVSERAVNGGDVVQPGSPLFTVVDPRSMRLEGAVPSSELGLVAVGAAVEFTVNGYPGRIFAGAVERISPVADPATGQVAISVSVPNAGGDLVGGLYAQGRIAAQERQGIVVPLGAVDLSGQSPTVLRVAGGLIERVPVELGIRDEQGERVELTAGVTAGDTLLVGAARGMTPGTPVRVQPLENRPPGS